MKRYAAVLAFACITLFPSGLFSQDEECRKKCADEFVRCSNHCMVMAADNTGCAERCERERDRCGAACGGAPRPAPDPDPVDEELEEDLGGDDFGDLEELEELDYIFDRVDGLPDDEWESLDDWHDWSIED